MLARVLAASIAGGIGFFVLGFVIWGLFLESMMKPHMIEYPGLFRETPVWAPLILANFVSAFFLAYIFENWAGIRTFAAGLKGGAIVYFLISLSFQLMFAAFWNLTKSYIPAIADVLATTVTGALVGGIIGMVLGMMSKEPAATSS